MIQTRPTIETINQVIEQQLEILSNVTTDSLEEIQGFINRIDTGIVDLQSKVEELGTLDPSKVFEFVEKNYRLNQFEFDEFQQILENKMTSGEVTNLNLSKPLIAQLVREAKSANRRAIKGGSGLIQPKLEKYSTYGGLVKRRIQPKFSTMVGKGISMPKVEYEWVEFGKWALSMNKLEENILSFKQLGSGKNVDKMNKIEISDDMKDIFERFIETKNLDKKRLDKLSSKEKRLFSNVINKSGLYGKYKIKLEEGETEQQENARFQMVKGIYSAGNDSPEVIKELKQFIIKFINDGRLDRKQGLEILFELNCVSGV